MTKSVPLTNFPDLVSEWSESNLRPIESVTHGSRYIATWVCSIDHRHTWKASVQNRVFRKSGCSVCAGRTVIHGLNDLESGYPEVAEDFSPDNPLLPSQVYSLSRKPYKWICGLGHTTVSTPYNRVRLNSGCMVCIGREVLAGTNDLDTLYPDLSLEWDYSVNSQSPGNYRPGSEARVGWICSEGHRWDAVIKARVGGTNCKECSLRRTSRVEAELFRLLVLEYPSAKQSHRLKLKDRYIFPDVTIEIEQVQIIVNYDGEYWHRNTEHRDTSQTHDMLESGILVLRIRECHAQRKLELLDIDHPNLKQFEYMFVREEYSGLSAIVTKIKETVEAHVQ